MEDKQELVEQWNALTYKVVEQDPPPRCRRPMQPQPLMPSSPLTLLRVPVIDRDIHVDFHGDVDVDLGTDDLAVGLDHADDDGNHARRRTC